MGLADLLQNRYGQGYVSPALNSGDGEIYDTSNVLSRMPRDNVVTRGVRGLAGFLREQSTPENVISSGLDTAANWMDWTPQVGQDTLAPLGAGVMGSMLSPSNALGSFGGRTPLKNVTWFGPDNKYPSVEVVPRQVAGGDYRFRLDDGLPVFEYPEAVGGFWRDSGPRLFRYIDEFVAPLGPDTYYRGALRRNDRDLLLRGRHRGSTNHATGEAEHGLSVAHAPEANNYNHWYLVNGRRIGQGADSEPLLDVATAKPVSELMSWAQVNRHHDDAMARRLPELGLNS